jgi:cystinosin
MTCSNELTLYSCPSLDFSGGVLSIAQLLLDGATLGWGGVVGDPIKFALGFVSMVFDVIFMIQHYCLFTDRNERKSSYDVASAGENVDIIADLEYDTKIYGREGDMQSNRKLGAPLLTSTSDNRDEQ